MAQIVEPLPLRKAPSAPAFSAPAMTLGRNEISFRETADADNQQKRRAVFRNLLRRKQRQSHTRLHNSQPLRHAKFSMAEAFALSKFEFQGLEPVRRNTSAGKLRSVERQGRRAPKVRQSGRTRPVASFRESAERAEPADYRKPTKSCRCSVIRMTFQVSAQLENCQPVEWIATELVERI